LTQKINEAFIIIFSVDVIGPNQKNHPFWMAHLKQ